MRCVCVFCASSFLLFKSFSRCYFGSKINTQIIRRRESSKCHSKVAEYACVYIATQTKISLWWFMDTFFSVGWLRLLWSVMDTEWSHDNNKAPINPTIFQDLKAELNIEQKPSLKFWQKKKRFFCELNMPVSWMPSTTEPNNLLLQKVMAA